MADACPVTLGPRLDCSRGSRKRNSHCETKKNLCRFSPTPANPGICCCDLSAITENATISSATPPGELFDVSEEGSGGPLAVVTTAGYQLGFEANMGRVVAFRHKVDEVGAWMKDLEGCSFSRAFTPHAVGYDGFTVSVWRSDEDMLRASYRVGLHRNYMDGHKTSSDFDRSSFTRFRILESSGKWNGKDPLF
jgi:hypothetical protein